MSAPDLLAKANALLRQKDAATALLTLRRLTTEFPRYAEGWFVRSSTESLTAQGLSAVRSAAHAVALNEDHPVYRAHLAQSQVSYGLWGDALETLGPLRSTDPARYEARIASSVGSVLMLCGLEMEAQPWAAHAALKAPGNVSYLYNEAQNLLYCGRIEDSRRAFARLLARFPDFAKAHWSLSTFDAANGGEARLAALYDALPKAGSAIDEVMYCYALFNTLDALNRPREAFVELEHGMRLQRARMHYSGEDTAALRRLEAAGATWLKRTADAAVSEGSHPIFIVGLPRSGTTLVERILGNHPDVAQGGELTCFSAALREQLGNETVNPMLTTVPTDLLQQDISAQLLRERYLGLTAYKAGGKPFFTDKYPFNFMLVPWIARALPDARILHLTRDPIDTCFGNLKQLFSGAYGACYSQQDMAEFYDAYRDLMAAWRHLLPGRILDVVYEELVAAPERVTASIFEFCGLPASQEAWRIERNTQPVATASTAQVRQPISARGIGAWRKYLPELQPLADLFGQREAANPEVGEGTCHRIPRAKE